MDNPTIDGMNEVIATFDGWEKRSATEFVKDGYMRYIWEFKYETSWDALMPVCHAIRERVYELKGNEKVANRYAKLNAQLMYGTIADVHLKAYDIIQWFNSSTNKQKDNE